MIPVASGQLVGALQSAGVDNLQTFAAVLRNEAAGLSWSDYFAINVIGLIDPVDEAESEFHEIIGGSVVPALGEYKKLTFLESKAAGHHLFRIVQSPGDLYAGDRIRSALIERRPAEGWGITTTEVTSH
jgi:hypothetical protein